MPTPFWCLLVAVLLPYVLSGIASYFKSKQFGSVDNNQPRLQSAALTGTGARAHAAQQNAWEALAVFTAAFAAAHFAGAAPGSVATASLIFIGARILHAVFYLTDIAPLRSLSFFVAIGACFRLFWLAAAAA